MHALLFLLVAKCVGTDRHESPNQIKRCLAKHDDMSSFFLFVFFLYKKNLDDVKHESHCVDNDAYF